MSEAWIVGINPVQSALHQDIERVRELRVEQHSRNPRVRALLQQAKALKLPVQVCSRQELEDLAAGARHQGVALRCKAMPPLTESALIERVIGAGASALVLLLDGVTDPHNFGACLRSAAAASATAVVVPRDRAVGITPSVRRAAAGAADRVPLALVTNLARTLGALKEAGVWLVGLDGDAEQTLYKVDLKGPIAMVMGGEGEGMRRRVRQACDFLARIPMWGGMESLNVSVATGVALFEALRQRNTGA